MLKSRGFTLVELLVTVAIIAILSAIGLMVYSSVLKQGRDSKRQSDLRSIQSALEQYYADQGFYPGITAQAGIRTCTNGYFNNWVTNSERVDCPLKNPAGNKTYLNQIPHDPLPAPQPDYCYVPTKAELYARLDNSPSGAPSYTCRNNTYNFKVTPP
ncbi:prepilin-type N-terminal cleavage/methylation domain-containing protein [Candidatus Daviesbacteria bacterium]|nr:prepilin-type N-terminal cleavage/methylation domain-containing protein [Candidatus Daviesbacteria bacterium]